MTPGPEFAALRRLDGQPSVCRSDCRLGGHVYVLITNNGRDHGQPGLARLVRCVTPMAVLPVRTELDELLVGVRRQRETRTRG